MRDDVRTERPCPYCAELIKSNAIICRFCRSQVASAADDDNDIAITPADYTNLVFYGLLALLALGAVALGIALYRSPFLKEPIPFGQTDAGIKTEAEAKRFIASMMKDPASVMFDGVTSGEKCVTGQVNAKNSFGGYVDYKRFF